MKEVMKEIKQGFMLLALLSSYYDVNAHVVLTFPPARPFSFDFLDNFHSTGPCGMIYHPAHKVMTSLVADKPFIVTWHIAYPHLGGFKIQLLHVNGSVKSELTNSQFIYKNDTTKLSHEVIIGSDVTCDHCVIRIIKEASEWTNQNANNEYLFWSCADVTIIKVKNKNECYKGRCLNGGTCLKGECTCVDRFEGNRCEYENDCGSDDECENGKCIVLNTTSYPKRVCFCSSGWMGQFCSIESPLGDAELKESEESDYFKIELYKEPKFQLFWKILEEKKEVEVALRVQTATWCAIGWRPNGLSNRCKEFPTNSFPKLENDVESEEISETFDTETESTINLHKRDVPSRQRRRVAIKRNVIKELCTAGNTSAAVTWATWSFNHVENNRKTGIVGELSSPFQEPFRGPEPEPESEPESSYKDTLHPMDCTDIIYAAAEGNYHRILDAYTRDRSTPKPDAWYGGVDDLTAAVGRRINGVLHIRFRRKLQTSDPTDHSLLDQQIQLIWSRGQTPYLFHHKPLSGLESCKASDYDYYRINELKYHGTKPSQRGKLSLNIHDNPEASLSKRIEGSFQHPDNCDVEDCEYRVEWNYKETTKKINFRIKAKVGEGEWAGIGFSKDTKMENSDAIVGWAEPSNGEAILTNRWLTSKSPDGVALDNGPSYLENQFGSYSDGMLTLNFARLLDTKDPNNLALTNCVYFLYAWGGKVTNGDIRKHDKSIVSTSMICIGEFKDSSSKKNVTSLMAILSCIFAYITSQYFAI